MDEIKRENELQEDKPRYVYAYRWSFELGDYVLVSVRPYEEVEEEERRKREAKEKRKAGSLRRKEAEATGLPLYKSYVDVPEGLYSRTVCARRLKEPVQEGEEPSAYVFSRGNYGYIPLYKRDGDKAL